MEDYEKLGTFYLGKKFDLESKKTDESLILYDSKDLVTHAVCLGMTGSGKTGLCLVLLEEAIIDNIPAIIIDPKGDVSNLLLSFPNLTGEDFLPWINEQDAAKKGLSINEYANKQAETWKNGIKEWGQKEDRIQRLRNAAEFFIYTPGSNSGIPVSILKSFAAPPSEIIQDSEELRGRIANIVTSLLTLASIDANPLESREHILLSTILDNSWKQGIELDLHSIIQQVQTPPVNKIGVLDLESFFPSKERFDLVMSLNNLIASPSFASWNEGQALDIGEMLYDKNGKPVVSIFSIAHLNDNERMFFVTLLLNQILSWMRTQSGTTSLRTILYMDEIFGYLPPVANPPSKLPLLTLLKQARAFGLGIVLATQNPADLDYKGLSNTGTWFIGRLQTENDKARVLDGLEGASQTSNTTFDRKEIEKIISRLENRVFVMSNANEDNLEIFQTRWALSYLRGPLTKDQIKRLMDPVKSLKKTKIQKQENISDPTGDTKKVAQVIENSYEIRSAQKQPTLHPDILQYFIPLNSDEMNKRDKLTYKPMVLGVASLDFTDSKLDIDVRKDFTLVTSITDEPIPIDWAEAEEIKIDISKLEKKPELEMFMELPSIATKSESYETWEKDFINWLYRNQKLSLWKISSLNKISKPDESEHDFKIRVETSMRENRDEILQKLRKKYSPKMRILQDRIQRAKYKLEVEQEQAGQRNMQAAMSLGSTLIGALIGRKIARGSASKASSMMRGVTRSMGEKRAAETLESYQQDVTKLENEFRQEVTEMENQLRSDVGNLEVITVKPDKKDISVKILALVWKAVSK